MADGLGSKISVLPEAEALDDSDLIYVVSGGASKKMTVGNAKTEFGGGGGGGSDGVIEGLDYDRAETLTMPDYTGYTYTPTEDGVLMLKAYGSVGGVSIEATGEDTLMLAVLGDTWTCPWIPVNKDTEYTLKRMAQSSGFPSDSWLKFIPWKRGAFLAPMIYSTEEREVGVWVDNKPLYQKSYINVAGTGASVNVTLSDLSDIETIFIVPQGSNSTDAIPFPYVHYSSANLIGGFFTIRNGVPTLAIRRGSDMAGVGLKFLTVCYTKTTDVAGSGSYGSLGIPMEHYDTEERVIGTWIDGRPIYQKTITKSFSTSSSSYNCYYGNIDYTSDFDITDWTNTYMNAILDKSFLTLSDGTVRNIWYVDYQNTPSIAFIFPFTNRSGQLTVTFQYVKGDDLA